MSKKLAFVLGLAIICLLVSGCKQNVLPSRNEIEGYEVIHIFGVDKSIADPKQVEVSFLVEKPQQSGGSKGGSGGEKLYFITSHSGPTVFEAQRILKTHSDKRQFFGFVDTILIGEEAAKEDISIYFDFIFRNEEIRLSPYLYIIRGASVKDFMNQASSESKTIMNRLKNIKQDIDQLSDTDQVRTMDVENMLGQKNTATVIPALSLREIVDETLIGGQLPQKDIEPCGYAVIKDFRLVGYLDETIARGWNFLVGKAKSAAVSIVDYTGMYVALETINQTTKVEPHFEGDTLKSVTYRIHIYSNLVEQQSRARILSENMLANLCKQQSDIIQSQAQQVIQKTQEFGVDCTGLGEQIRMQHPYKWQKIKDQWGELYRNLPINIVVESHIRRSYDIHEPVGYDFTMEKKSKFF